MGIRLTHMLGYGLSDVEYAEGRITDPRINVDSRLFDWNREASFTEYRAWMKKHCPDDYTDEAYNYLDRSYLHDLRRLRKRERHASVNDCVVYREEFGLGNVLCIRPIACPDWTRYADTLDTYIESRRQKITDPEGKNYGMESRVEILDGIYPFTTLMDKRNGQRLRGSDHWLLFKNSDQDVGDGFLDALAQEMGFSSHADALENARPMVPAEVRDICRFGEIFTDESVWLELRPMLYTWWS